VALSTVAAKPQKTLITAGQKIPSNKGSATRNASKETTTKATRDKTTANMLLPISRPPARHALPDSGIAG
jgi:hypothetical protein